MRFELDLSLKYQESSFGVRNVDIKKLRSYIDVGIEGQNELGASWFEQELGASKGTMQSHSVPNHATVW